MASGVTKKDLEETTSIIIDAMDNRFQKLEKRMDSFDKKMDKLTTTLDSFLKRLLDFEEEFTIVKAEVRRIKTVIKEKLGVDIKI